jgi:hypothetical protein
MPKGLEDVRAMSKIGMRKMAKWPEGQRARGPKGFEQNVYEQNGKMARGPKGQRAKVLWAKWVKG